MINVTVLIVVITKPTIGKTAAAQNKTPDETFSALELSLSILRDKSLFKLNEVFFAEWFDNYWDPWLIIVMSI